MRQGRDLIGVALALLSAAGYGVSDFIGGVASRQVAAIRVVLVSCPIAMVLLTAVAAVVGGHVSPSAIAWGTLCEVGQAFGIWWFYAAPAAGPISVVSPLAAVVVTAIPVIAGVALGERPGVVAAAGIVLALIAVVLISRHVGDRPLARPASNPGEDTNQRTFTKRVAWLTVGSGVAFGLTLVVIREAPLDAALLPAGLRPDVGQHAGDHRGRGHCHPATAFWSTAADRDRRRAARHIRQRVACCLRFARRCCRTAQAHRAVAAAPHDARKRAAKQATQQAGQGDNGGDHADEPPHFRCASKATASSPISMRGNTSARLNAES